MSQKKSSTTKQTGVFLLSIGDELLDGRTMNTNASYFGEQLRLSGIPVQEVRCISDNIEQIASCLRESKKFPLVITTGGLGPTNDDRTLEGASRAFRLPLVETKASLDHVTKRYQARNLPLTPSRLRMAKIPKGSLVLENVNGTAPAVALKVGKSQFYFLPGPPNECRPIFAGILKRAEKLVPGKKLYRREFWRTFGKGESDIYHSISPMVEELERKYPETFTFGVHISFPCIDLTMEAWKVKGRKLPTEAELKKLSAYIDEKIGNLCFTRQREDLSAVVSRILKEKQLTLSTAESCTGGLIGKMLTDISGSSSFYWGGVVAYDNCVKKLLLGVEAATLASDGAVSEATVRQMAEGIRSRLKTNYSLAVSGVAGPDGGSADKPVGTIHVALSSAKGSKTLHRVILNGSGSRDQNRIIAAHLALDLLRDALREW